MGPFLPNSAPPSDTGAGQAELAEVLASDLFKRSPKLSRLLSYICEKHFLNESSQVTEYSIALDVLKRDSAFDPQVDSVVRVDVHHLRKRLKTYYESQGKDHTIEITVPSGRYAPEFVRRAVPGGMEPAEVVANSNGHADEDTQPEAAKTPKPARILPRPWIAAAAIAAAAVFLGVGWFFTRANAAASSKGNLPVSAIGQEPVRILAGERSGNYTDKAGRVWLTDRYFTGGTSFYRPHTIFRTQDPEIFQAGREGQFAYELPLKPGVYQLQLYFAETGVSGEGLRGVSLAINGIPHTSLDVASDAGGADTATIKVYKDISPAKDGLLHLTFQSSGPSFVNAIEVLPGLPGKMLPLRFTARDTAIRDHEGRTWLPDLGFYGGRHSARAARLTNTADPELYQIQRFGHFNYSIPVVEGGRYALKLHFAETYFGLNGESGEGSRIFDVYCNGTTLLKGFDILKASGGVGGRALVEIFHNLEPSPQGKLDLSFVPVVNYALLDAVEVEEE